MIVDTVFGCKADHSRKRLSLFRLGCLFAVGIVMFGSQSSCIRAEGNPVLTRSIPTKPNTGTSFRTNTRGGRLASGTTICGDFPSQENGSDSTVIFDHPIVAAPGHAFTNAITRESWQNRVPSGTYRKRYICTADCTSLELVFGNQFIAKDLSDAPTLGNLHIRATLEYPTGQPRRQLTFAGVKTVVIGPNMLVRTDPIHIVLHKDDPFYVWTYVEAKVWPTGPILLSSPPFSEGFTPNKDVTQANGKVNPTWSFTAAYAPMAVLGSPSGGKSTSNIAIIGDSIASGTGDTVPWGAAQQIDMGYIVRALARGSNPGIQDDFGYMRISAYGELAAQFAEPKDNDIRLRLVKGCSYAICEYGANDVAAGRSVVEIQQDLLTIWTMLAQQGIEVYQTTITPSTVSTNGWTDLSGQTVPDAAQEAVRTTINNWFRDLTAAGAIARSRGALKGCFDVADIAESSRDSGKWRPRFTLDGRHPSNMGARALATAINVGLFVH